VLSEVGVLESLKIINQATLIELVGVAVALLPVFGEYQPDDIGRRLKGLCLRPALNRQQTAQLPDFADTDIARMIALNQHHFRNKGKPYICLAQIVLQ
jgi:hypothetical protein